MEYLRETSRFRNDRGRVELEESILKVFFEASKKRHNQDELRELIFKNGINYGDAVQIMNGNIPLATISGLKLGIIAQSIYQYTQKDYFKLGNWFKNEYLNEIVKYIDDYRSGKLDKKERIELPITFNEVIQLSEDMWITAISMKDIAKIYDSNILTYNFETQREAELVDMGDMFIMKPKLHEKSVNNIVESILADNYFPPKITLNVLKQENHTEDNQITFKKTEDSELVGKLTINKGSRVDIIDGFHNSTAILMALLEMEKDFERLWKLEIVHLSIEDAGQYVVQNDKQNKMDDEHISSLDVSRPQNMIVKRLNTYSNSEMRGKIATDYKVVRDTAQGFTMQTTMANSIKLLWSLKTNIERDKVSEYLMEFFNELFYIKQDEFISSPIKTKQECYLLHPNMFVFYLCLAKELESYSDWKDRLAGIMNTMDFEDRELWKGLGLFKRTPKQVATLVKPFRELARENVEKWGEIM